MITTMITSIATLGILLSLYAVYVEHQAKKNAKYKAVCDISKKASCTAAFTSSYGRIAGFSNARGGVFFYLTIIAVSFLQLSLVLTVISSIALAGSLYLAYLQYIKMKNFCVVCTAIYVINALIFALAV